MYIYIYMYMYIYIYIYIYIYTRSTVTSSTMETMFVYFFLYKSLFFINQVNRYEHSIMETMFALSSGDTGTEGGEGGGGGAQPWRRGTFSDLGATVGGAYKGEGQEVEEERVVKRSCVTRCVLLMYCSCVANVCRCFTSNKLCVLLMCC
jgi:hypothetical protein